MKQLLLLIAFFLSWQISICQTNPRHVYVKPHTKSNGTQVPGHHRTAPNNTNKDNFTTKPNVNPYTGKPGYIKPDNSRKPNYTPRTNTTPKRNNTPRYYDIRAYHNH